jgi:small-conductance mechanosensitive channel
MAQKARNGWDDQLILAIKGPGRLIFVTIALIFTFHVSPATIQKHSLIIILAKNLLILSVLWLSYRFILVFVQFSRFFSSFNVYSKNYFRMIVNIFFGLIGTLIVLDAIGISVTPILASLGVGSLAIALALQDTLGNFFSGIYTLIDRPVRPGDFVRIDDNVEGIVKRIGWRSTSIDLVSGNEVILPNTKLAQAILTNYDLPVHASTISIPLCVEFNQDIDRIELITLETAKDIQKNSTGADPEFIPSIKFNKIGENGVITTAAAILTRGLMMFSAKSIRIAENRLITLPLQ